MKDQRFRDSLPVELKEDVEKYFKNPSCQCNTPLYEKIIKQCKEQVQQYFSGRTLISDLVHSNPKEQANTWQVINCHIDELEYNLKKLYMGKKQIAIARFEDQVTVVVNEAK